MSVKHRDDFQFWVPAEIISKGGGKSKDMIIQGIASTADRDSDNEVLDPNGYDLSYFNNFGYFNWHHGTKESPKSIIGEPIESKITPKGLFVKGKLYKDSKTAQEVYELGQVLEKNSKNRRLGFSIEGKALERDPLDPRKITKAKITGCAVTFAPKNKNTLLEIVKGELEEDQFSLVFDENEIKHDLDIFKAETGREFVVEEEDEEDEDKEKSLSTASGGALVKESLEGGNNNKSKNKIKSNLDDKIERINKSCNSKKTKYLTKSECIDKIFNVLTDIDFEKADKILNFAIKFAQSKNLKMNDKKQITEESLEKALDFINDIEKANSTPSEFTNRNGDIQTFFQKMEDGSYRKMVAKGGEAEYADDKKYVKKGDSYEAEDDEGDEGEEKGKNSNKMSKAETTEEVVTDEDSDSLVKAFEDMTNLNKNAFGALGTIQKATMDLVSELRSDLENLREENDDLKKAIEDIGSNPIRRRKSLGREGVRALEKFAKAEGSASGNTLSVSKNKTDILNVLDDMAFNGPNGYDQEIAKAMAGFESTSALPKEIIQRIKIDKNISVTA